MAIKMTFTYKGKRITHEICPLCNQQISLDHFFKCLKCGEIICYACYNPKQKKCAQCETE